ncbi:DedA family protein [Clostridium gasigenes]|uniref:DedA family protein n=1 Tax=Clostridium gasigenes TaxID=94869 RepID=UPI0014383195|nr:DedA family protein [Clostridium gasigenes]MBU3131255.1 DedA family protein [Clostridium gasigenes]NKF08144.1 DedA family protein [Clostridium gasigenes]QSW18504.1 DedA family protein [Clostridium gasigenes]
MEAIKWFIDVFMHLDIYLEGIINTYGMLTYVLLFLIIFCETGLVITPILPGDSLIFAAAAFAGLGVLNIFILIGVVVVAAILGDAVNYIIGNKLGDKLINNRNRFIKKSYIDKTHSFYDKYGGKTIIIARFIPIVRTFAPFVAGVTNMKYKEFLLFNAIGGVFWGLLVSGVGYFFGNIKFVQENFTIVVLGIIFVSILPAIVEVVKHKMSKNTEV